MYYLPTHITIEEQEYTIRNKGDYRMVLNCFSALQDEDLDTEQERILLCLFIFYENFDTIEDILALDENVLIQLVEEMSKFFNCGQEDQPGAKSQYKLIDWEKDEQLIMSGVNNVANKELRAEPYVHWWTFMGYYMAIGDSPLATVVGIRNKIAKNKKLEKHEREFKQDNPQYFSWDFRSQENREMDDYIKALWNNDGKEVEEIDGV